jgi:DNA-binding transcriptional regulator YdaS (Cro superfamily)
MTLRDYLDATGRKPADFAFDLAVADNTVRRWLSGTRTPSPGQMRAIHDLTKGLVQPNDWILQ